jgi:hypothetical protein
MASGSVSRPERASRSRFDRFVDSRLLLVLEIALLLAITLSVVTKTWQDRMWLGFVLTGATFLVWSPELLRARVRRWWFAYVAGIFLYTLLRAFADETAIPIRATYVVEADQALFFGLHPVSWTQRQFFSAANIDLLDYFAVAVHWSFFVAPHAMAVAIFFWRRPLFPQYTVIVVGTMYLGLVLFFLVPTEPPWLASLDGHLPSVVRVMDFVGTDLHGETYNRVYATLGEPNSVAAMPSIHMGVTLAMALWARDHARRWFWPLVLYSLLMGVVLVYMAEHYVLDLIAGAACATAAYVVSRPLGRRGTEVEHSRPPR